MWDILFCGGFVLFALAVYVDKRRYVDTKTEPPWVGGCALDESRVFVWTGDPRNPPSTWTYGSGIYHAHPLLDGFRLWDGKTLGAHDPKWGLLMPVANLKGWMEADPETWVPYGFDARAWNEWRDTNSIGSWDAHGNLIQAS